MSDSVSAMSKRTQTSDEKISSSNSSAKRRKPDEKPTKKVSREKKEDEDFDGTPSVSKHTGQAKSYPKEIDPKTNKEQVLWLCVFVKRS